MRRLIVAALAVVGLAAIPSPAHAASGCINGIEFDTVQLGWTRSQVEVMIGAKADYVLIFDNATSTGYNHCGGNTAMMAGFTFRNGTLWQKQWAWREL